MLRNPARTEDWNWRNKHKWSSSWTSSGVTQMVCDAEWVLYKACAGRQRHGGRWTTCQTVCTQTHKHTNTQTPSRAHLSVCEGKYHLISEGNWLQEHGSGKIRAGKLLNAPAEMVHVSKVSCSPETSHRVWTPSPWWNSVGWKWSILYCRTERPQGVIIPVKVQ